MSKAFACIIATSGKLLVFEKHIFSQVLLQFGHNTICVATKDPHRHNIKGKLELARLSLINIHV